MKRVGGLTHGRGMTDGVKTKWILGMPVLNNICTNIEQYVNLLQCKRTACRATGL